MAGAPERDQLSAQLTVRQQPAVRRLREQSRVQVTRESALRQSQVLGNGEEVMGLAWV